jgi:hypothetical protein
MSILHTWINGNDISDYDKNINVGVIFIFSWNWEMITVT